MLSTEHNIFNYKDPKHGYRKRIESFTNDDQYSNTSNDGKAMAGFSQKDSSSGMIECKFCDLSLYEPSSDRELISAHANGSPDCILVQSEVNYKIRKPQYQSLDSRIKSFSENTRFQTRSRRGYNDKAVDRLMPKLAESGFYFAEQVHVFDQIKCFFCDATVDCLIFRNQDLAQDQINTMHAHKGPRCTFLIDQIGALKFNEFQSTKYQNFEVRIETGRKKSSDLLPDPNHLRRMKVVPIPEEDTFGAKIESTQKFEILRNQLECRYCLKNRATIMFLPCRHMASCPPCQERITSDCPVCDTVIEYKIGIHI